MKITRWHRAAAVFAMMGGLVNPQAARAAENSPKELLQYINDAKGRGVADSEIRQQAQNLGWPPAMVDAAIARGKGKPSASAKGTAGAAQYHPPAAAAETRATTENQPRNAQRIVVPDDYVIGSGDTLQISVWKEQEVSVPSVVVRPDGKITVPLLKDVEVVGLTPRQAETIITEGLSKYYSDPNVTVVVAAIGSKKIYMIGAARKEGPLTYNYGMTIMQALSEAGGLTEYAKRKQIYVLRTAGGREYRLDFNYDDVVRGEKPEQNLLLMPGDTVVIPH